MSRGLEALEKVFNYNDFYEVKSYNKIDLKKSFKKEYNTIKQALTPPTEQEVCEALNNDKRNPYEDWEYDEKLNCFWSDENNDVEISEHYRGGITIDNKVRLMICRFYEGKSER